MRTRSRGEEDPQVSALDTLVGREQQSETRFFSGRWITKLSFLSPPPLLIQNCQSLVNNNTGPGLVCIFLRRSPFSPLYKTQSPSSNVLPLSPEYNKKVGTIRKCGERRRWPRFQPYTCVAMLSRCHLIWKVSYKRSGGQHFVWKKKKRKKPKYFMINAS